MHWTRSLTIACLLMLLVNTIVLGGWLHRSETLTEDLKKARETLIELKRTAGYAPLSGPGVEIRLYDAPHGYHWLEVVHARDIRMILDDLLAAGATGLELGGRRITALSWFRCAGPVIVVDGEPVAVNPVVIRAIGDPDPLAGSIDSWQEIFAATGKRITVAKLPRISLNSHPGRSPAVMAAGSGQFEGDVNAISH